MSDKARFFYGYIVVIASFFIMLVIVGLHSSFGVFFKPIIAELGWTRAITSGAFSLSVIVQGLISIVMGGLNDRFGPRVVTTICVLISALGYMLMSQIQTLWQFYLFYGILIGVGCSIFVPIVSTVSRWFVQRRSLMTGIVLAGIGVGTLILSPMTNQLISAYGWRTSCLLLGVMVMIVGVIAAQFLKRDPSKLGQVVYGEHHNVEAGLKLRTKAFSLKEAALTRQFWILFIAFIFYGFSVMAIQVHLVPYATDLGISATSAAVILATAGGMTIIGQIALGSTGDKIGNRQAFLIGIGLLLPAVVGLMLVRELWMIYLIAVIFGLGYGDCSTQESPLTAWLFGLKSHGLIYGFLSLGFSIGAAIGPVIFGYIFDMTGNYQFAFLTCATLSIITIILLIFLKPLIAESTFKTVNSKDP